MLQQRNHVIFIQIYRKHYSEILHLQKKRNKQNGREQMQEKQRGQRKRKKKLEKKRSYGAITGFHLHDVIVWLTMCSVYYVQNGMFCGLIRGNFMQTSITFTMKY